MGQDIHILVADDEEFIRKLSSRILSLKGFQTIQAENGDRALELYNEHKNSIALVVLDIKMPGRSGIEVYRNLIALNPHVRVILCSGYGEYELPPDSGCYFVQKPFSVNSLQDTVQKVLNISTEEIEKNNEKVKNLTIFEDA